MILFAATPDDEESVSMARTWLRVHHIHPNEARLIKREGQVLIIDKGETWRRIKPSLQEV